MAVHMDIHKNLGDFKLNIALDSDSNRIGILGASGCGKSMTLRCIAGIETPDTGQIVVDGQTFFDSTQHINLRPQQRKTGYLFQNYALFPTMSVEKNVAAGLHGDKTMISGRVGDVMKRFGLLELEKRYPWQLSGGQQQRAALARMMVCEPEIILLDEPSSALDVYLKDKVQQELLEMLEDYKGTVILVSHNRDEIYRFSQELMVIDNGSKVVSGTTEGIFEQPRRRTAAVLTGCKNITDAEMTDKHHVKVPAWDMILETEHELLSAISSIGYRAHDFVPVWGERQKNCVPFRLRSTATLQFEKKYFLEEGMGVCWFVQRDGWRELEEKGMPDYLQVQPEKVLWLED